MPNCVNTKENQYKEDWKEKLELKIEELQNNLDSAVAEDPKELIVYGGIGKAARNWECYDSILESF